MFAFPSSMTAIRSFGLSENFSASLSCFISVLDHESLIIVRTLSLPTLNVWCSPRGTSSVSSAIVPSILKTSESERNSHLSTRTASVIVFLTSLPARVSSLPFMRLVVRLFTMSPGQTTWLRYHRSSRFSTAIFTAPCPKSLLRIFNVLKTWKD